MDGGVARFLHWLVVVLIAAQFLTGWTGPGMHRCTQPIGLIAWQLGVRAALVAAVDWRITLQPPPASLPPMLSTSRASRTFFIIWR